MKHRLFVSLLLFVPLLLPGCYKSEISDAPEAKVSDTAATAPAGDTAAATAAQPAGPVTTSRVVKEKSSIEFVGAKVTRDHKGKFHNFDGTIEYAGSTPQRISFEIDLNSMETDTPKLTEHLKTPDFFDVARFPRATFTSTSLTPAPAGTPAGTTHELRGVLDMHGVKKEVTIPVNAQQTAEGVRATSEFKINRHDWGISYRGAADDLIRDDVLIRLNLMFPPPPAA